jgi:hypothetical protein
LACNEASSRRFQALNEGQRQDYLLYVFSMVVAEAKSKRTKIRIKDGFRQTGLREVVEGRDGDAWMVEITSRRMGIDNGKDTLVHVDQILERTLEQMVTKSGKQRPLQRS